MASPYVTSSRGGGRRPQLPAFCRTRRPITTTVRVSTLQQLLWLLLLVVFLQLTTILLVLAGQGPGPAPLRQLAVPENNPMANAPLAAAPGSLRLAAIASRDRVEVPSPFLP